MTNFDRPTEIAGAIVMGPVLVVHDHDKMARGEPCTSVYRFDSKDGTQEEIVAFTCKPVEREAAEKFTVKCRRGAFANGPYLLTEYQFAGDTEAHGVPARP